MEVTEFHLNLISDIYNVVLDDTGWPSILDRLAHITEAVTTNTIYFDSMHSDLQLSSVGTYFTEETVSRYVSEIAPMEVPLIQKIAEVPVGVFYSDTEIFRAAGMDVNKSPISDFFLGQARISKRSGIRLNDARGWFDSLTFNYADTQQDMTAAQKNAATIFLPHFAKAIEISRPFKLLQSRFNAVLSALDKFHIGTYIVDSIGTVIILNTEALRIADENHGLYIDGMRRLRFSEQTVHESFRKALSRFTVGDQFERGQANHLFKVQKPARNSVLLGELVSLGGTGMELERSFKGALLLVIDPDNRQKISTHGLELVYGLSSAESEVCRLLIDGLSTSEIADSRGVKPETVKSQIANLFRKTGANHRVELVKTAHSLELPVDLPDKDI